MLNVFCMVEKGMKICVEITVRKTSGFSGSLAAVVSLTKENDHLAQFIVKIKFFKGVDVAVTFCE